jgi:drug/metabolite transporter superfamily protein YnfA
MNPNWQQAVLAAIGAGFAWWTYLRMRRTTLLLIVAVFLSLFAALFVVRAIIA